MEQREPNVEACTGIFNARSYGAREGTCREKKLSRAHEITSRGMGTRCYLVPTRCYLVKKIFLHVPSRAP